jgi:hypothetical protein
VCRQKFLNFKGVAAQKWLRITAVGGQLVLRVYLSSLGQVEMEFNLINLGYRGVHGQHNLPT